ncbi:MAG: hypothetical protein EDX89_07535 [Acidobacteria bacterium]|nr:MAG: hypothetical protein EDX89_07535 [Acidobacteriota bacterium]
MTRDVPVLLLAGPGSRRLERAALAHAARLLCRKAGLAGHPGPEAEAACPDCRRTARREHPDLSIAAPESRRRSNVPAFEESSGSRETTIPTALVRAIAADAARLPYEGARRVVVLLDVDRTEAAAFSALLKTLEEPPERTRFVLTATRARRLPTTILSRVVLTTLAGTPRAETARLLASRGMPAEEADARTAFVPDDADEAAALDLAGARQERDGLLEALSGTLLTGSAGWAVTLAARLSGDDPAEAARRLGLLALLLRDAAAASVDPAGRHVVHRERYRDLARLGEAGGPALLDAARQALDLAGALSDSRRQPRLAAEAFALSLLPEAHVAARGSGPAEG